MRTPVETELGGLPRKFGGYASAPAESLLRELASECDRLGIEVEELRQRASAMRDELATVQAPERELREAFVTAQRETDRLREATSAEVDSLRSRVRDDAGAHRASLDEESAQIRREIDRMRTLEDEFRESIRVILVEALRRLEPADATPTPPEPPIAEAASPPTDAPVPAPEETPTAEAAVHAAPQHEPSIDDTQDIPLAPIAPTVPPTAFDEKRGEPLHRSFRPFLLALAILATGAGIAVAIWQLRTDAPGRAPTATATPETSTEAIVETATSSAEPAADTASAGGSGPAETESESGQSAPASDPARGARLVLRAVTGDSWLTVHEGSLSGKLLFEGFLYDGQSRRFDARRLWIRMGNGGNLRGRLNGERLQGLPAGTADVLVTADGVRTLALG